MSSTFQNVVNSMPDMSHVAGWSGLILAIFTLSYFATTLATVKRLRAHESVSESSIQFVYSISSVALFISVVAMCIFILTLYKLYKP